MLYFKEKLFLNQFNFYESDAFGMDTYWYKYTYYKLFSSVGAHIGHTLKNTVRQAA